MISSHSKGAFEIPSLGWPPSSVPGARDPQRETTPFSSPSRPHPPLTGRRQRCVDVDGGASWQWGSPSLCQLKERLRDRGGWCWRCQEGLGGKQRWLPQTSTRGFFILHPPNGDLRGKQGSPVASPTTRVGGPLLQDGAPFSEATTGGRREQAQGRGEEGPAAPSSGFHPPSRSSSHPPFSPARPIWSLMRGHVSPRH